MHAAFGGDGQLSSDDSIERARSALERKSNVTTDLRRSVDLVACPVLAALYSRGHLRPDREGKVTLGNLRDALQETGASFALATFQAVGIAGYTSGDPHQNHREVGPMSFIGGRYLNVFTMQPADRCTVGKNSGGRTSGGFPCNANPEFQQHGYSTTLRDSRFDVEDPGRRMRFDFWIAQELVHRPDLDEKEPVLLLEGMIKMLAKARKGDVDSTAMLSGDFNGEYSLTRKGEWEGSNLQEYHPSVSEPDKYRALSAWQPLFAWCGWWTAFARHSGATSYFLRSDLEAFFLRGDFPEDWEARSWGFRDDFKVMESLEGRGLGDEWITFVNNMDNFRFDLGGVVDEVRFNVELLETMVLHLGIQKDEVHRTYPS